MLVMHGNAGQALDQRYFTGLLRDRFESLKLLADFAGPMVSVTGTADTSVPEALALPLKAAHRRPLLHWSQPGVGHNSIDVNPRAEGWRRICPSLPDRLEFPRYLLVKHALQHDHQENNCLNSTRPYTVALLSQERL